MARKTAADLKPKGAIAFASNAPKQRESSWAALGWDSSMTSIAVVCMCYDGLLDKMVGPTFGEIRWMPDDDYWLRLGQAAKAHELALDVLSKFSVPIENVYHAFEEPWYYGAVKHGQSSWLKQQAEIAGAFKGGLVRWGYTNMYEINNSQWHATLRKEGVEFRKSTRGAIASEKSAIKLANKFMVKTWAMKAWGLPDLPDLVKSKSGAKIPRPESGFGAKAKADQPSDVYDAAAICAWCCDLVDSLPR